MKSGTYRVSFEIELTDCRDQDEAALAVAQMVSDAIDDSDFPELEFELLEALDMEYNTEENELEELNF